MATEALTKGSICDSVSFPLESWTVRLSLITCSRYDWWMKANKNSKVSQLMHKHDLPKKRRFLYPLRTNGILSLTTYRETWLIPNKTVLEKDYMTKQIEITHRNSNYVLSSPSQRIVHHNNLQKQNRIIN